jgi:exodeoxyribonuclease VII small subunit
MSDERSTFETTKARLEDIVLQVRRKDVSLEQSLDMLEEAVRLVNQCNDLIDQTSWRSDAAEGEPDGVAADDEAPVTGTEVADGTTDAAPGDEEMPDDARE